jgi:hypothetical protein
VGSAARFTALLAVGVAIMVIYVRSGESLVVLLLCLATFLAGLAVWIKQPWAVGAGLGAGRSGRAGTGDGRGPNQPDLRWDDTWRSGHDITWDQQGVRGVTVGDRLPGMTVWSRIDRITVGRYRASADDRSPQRRQGIHLELYRRQGRPLDTADPSEVWLCLGPDQDPERVAADLASAWRRAMAARGTDGAGVEGRHHRPDRGLKRPTGR